MVWDRRLVAGTSPETGVSSWFLKIRRATGIGMRVDRQAEVVISCKILSRTQISC